MTKKIIILGGKGTAVNIAEGIVDAYERFNSPVEFIGFAIDDINIGSEINGFPVLCKTTDVNNRYGKFDDIGYIFQMNRQDKMKERSLLIERYNIPSGKWHTFIHPTAFVSKSVKIGHGSVVFAHCAIHSNVTIGNHCTFCALTTIGHDTTIGNNVFTATHVCIGSNVKLGNCIFFGQNSTVSSSVSIHEDNLIGLGSVVVKNIHESNKIYIGSPAKPFKDLHE